MPILANNAIGNITVNGLKPIRDIAAGGVKLIRERIGKGAESIAPRMPKSYKKKPASIAKN